tara:strand:+ start:11076 stop:11249 length:174 start_codon:yes stop_codon:yes gene_type:complete
VTPKDNKYPIEEILFIGRIKIKTNTALKMTGPNDEAKYLPKELRIAIPIEDKDISNI